MNITLGSNLINGQDIAIDGSPHVYIQGMSV
jgi:hypothetical protein